MHALITTFIALLGCMFPRICTGLTIPGHLQGRPTGQPWGGDQVAREAPAPNLPTTPTNEKTSPTSLYFKTAPTLSTAVMETKILPQSTGDTSSTSITTPPDALDRRWETVIPDYLPWHTSGDLSVTITDPADLGTCCYADTTTTTWRRTITLTPGACVAMPFDEPLFYYLSYSPPCYNEHFTWVSSTSSSSGKLSSSPTVVTITTTTTTPGAYGYGYGYGQHQERAAASPGSAFTTAWPTNVPEEESGEQDYKIISDGPGNMSDHTGLRSPHADPQQLTPTATATVISTVVLVGKQDDVQTTKTSTRKRWTTMTAPSRHVTNA